MKNRTWTQPENLDVLIITNYYWTTGYCLGLLTRPCWCPVSSPLLSAWMSTHPSPWPQVQGNKDVDQSMFRIRSLLDPDQKNPDPRT